VVIVTVVGVRPNFIKLAALHEAFKEYPIWHVIVHTGQHYDFELYKLFFQELSIPEPMMDLEIGPGTQAEQVGRGMEKLESFLKWQEQDWVVVLGDANAALSGALAAKKIGLKVAHIEAGLRSEDWSMPEEINRIVVDRISDLLFVTEPAAIDNLLRDGREPYRIHHVGNVMIDTLLRWLPKSKKPDYLPEEYALLTMHRPSNVDDPELLNKWMKTFERLSVDLPIVFPIHPRTDKRLEEIGYRSYPPNFIPVDPMGYLEMIGALRGAKVVLTDSGGIQEETTALGIPCLTLRDNTERPITVTQGSNTLVGGKPSDRLIRVWKNTLNEAKKSSVPELWDGKAANRIANVLLEAK
jgi:UDP-N-acetylglucosamine 2-epimerase (non-hydrolysing)